MKSALRTFGGGLFCIFFYSIAITPPQALVLIRNKAARTLMLDKLA